MQHRSYPLEVCNLALIHSFLNFLTPFHPLVGLIMPRLSNTEIGSDEYNYVHRKYRGDDYFEKVRIALQRQD